MNKSKGNMYGFVTHTWNPIRGTCEYGCQYCYMKRWTLPPIGMNDKVLMQGLGNGGRTIFVGSGCDMFAPSVDDKDIQRVLDRCGEEPLNHYLFQSKNPERFQSFKFPPGSVLCTTIESNYLHLPAMGGAPHPADRYHGILKAAKAGEITMVTIEPIMDFDLGSVFHWLLEINPHQVNIGADSGNNGLAEPSPEKVRELIRELEDACIPVYEKDNLKRLVGGIS